MIASPGPRPGDDVDPEAPWFVIVGDETDLPAIAEVVAALPPGRTAHVIVELPHDDDRIDLASPAVLITTWLARGDQGRGESMEAEVRRLHLPLGPGRFWVAGEAGAVGRIGEHLVTDRHVDRARVELRAHPDPG